MSEFTPGPWFIGAQNDATYIIDRRPDHSNDYPNHDADTHAIARVFDDVRGNENAGRCNARLIAAAPQMLAALEAAKFLIESEIADPEDCGTYHAVLAAIAKATGVQA